MFLSLKRWIGCNTLAIGIAVGTALTTMPAHAEFPEKPIRMIVPVKPGGTIDTVARLIQKAIEKQNLFDRPMVVVNKPGAAGAVGTRTVKDADPDGYSIVIFHSGIVTASATGVTDFDHNSFKIIAKTGEMPMGIGTAKGSGLDTVDDLMKAAKDNPGMKYASNVGLPVHFLPLMLAESAGVKVDPVQAGGGVNRLNSVVGGHTKFAVFSVLDFIKYEAAGLQPVVLFADERHPRLPDVPTAKELGYDVTWVEIRVWLAPEDTPADRIDVLAKAFEAAMKDPEVMAKFEELGMDPTFARGDEVAADLDERLSRIQAIVSLVSQGSN